MKRLVIILMVLLVAAMPWSSSVVLAGLDYSIEWTRQFGTSNDDKAEGVAVDSSGNVFVAGYTKGTLPGQSNSGGNDAFVRKYNSAGAEQWTHQFGTDALDYALGVAVDSLGNVYVVGQTSGTLPGQSNSGGNDAFVRKYNSAGAEQWTRQFGTSVNDEAEGVAVDSSGNALVVGTTLGTFPGQSNAGSEDAFIRKYNSAGAEQWTCQFGTSASDAAFGVALDTSRNVFVVGYTSGTLREQSRSGDYDAFICKYSSAGVEQWTRQFGTSDFDEARGVAVDSSGNAYVAGDTGGTLPGQSSSGGFDAFVRKYNSAGVEQWTRQFGTSAEDEAYGVAVDSSGNTSVVGTTEGAFPFYTNLSSYDVFVRQYNSAGVEQRTRQFGTSASDYAWGVAVDSSGNTYVVGSTFGTLLGQSSAGSGDAFVMKFAFTTQSRVLYSAEYRWSAVYTPKTQLAPSAATFMTWQQVRFENKGTADAYNVTATITWVPANVTVTDGQISFGNIPSGGSAWSTDDFALVTDMTNPQPSKQGILWRVEYDDAQGVHHVLENVPQLTKGMVDPQQTGGKSK